MKNYQVILTEEELEILKKETQLLVERAKRDVNKYSDIGAKLSQLSETLSGAQVIKQNTADRKKGQAAKALNLCPDHPTYSAVRPPTIDCSGHWAAYRLMNPNNYDRARRNFERAQRQKKKEN